jgi:hypothetical protein
MTSRIDLPSLNGGIFFKYASKSEQKLHSIEVKMIPGKERFGKRNKQNGISTSSDFFSYALNLTLLKISQSQS